MEPTEKKERDPRKNLEILETLLRSQNLNEQQKRETIEKIERLKSELNNEATRKKE